ncbi:MAG: hypothetical protein HYY00_08810 [Chloroflexi bacterium]|nr:hypothetical protein [Chloroflexota bacterium]
MTWQPGLCFIRRRLIAGAALLLGATLLGPGSSPGQALAASLAPPLESSAQAEVIAVTDVSVSPHEVPAGEPVEVRATLRNYGSSAREYSVPLLVNGVVEHRWTGELPGGAGRILAGRVVRPIPDSYVVQVGSQMDVFRVFSSEIVFSDLVVRPSTVVPGQPVEVTVRARNLGMSVGRFRTTLMVNGQVERRIEGVLQPGESREMVLPVRDTQVGAHAVSMEGLTGDFQVAAPVVDLPLPPRVPISTAMASALDAEGQPLPIVGDAVVVATVAQGGLDFLFPVALKPGQAMASFHDPISGVAFQDGRVELPLRGPLYQVVGRVLAQGAQVTGEGLVTVRVHAALVEAEMRDAVLSREDGFKERVGVGLGVELSGFPTNGLLHLTPTVDLPGWASAALEVLARQQGKTVSSVALAVRAAHRNLPAGAQPRTLLAVAPELVERSGGLGELRAVRIGKEGAAPMELRSLGDDPQGRVLLEAAGPNVPGDEFVAIVSMADFPQIAVSKVTLSPQVAEPGEPVRVEAGLGDSGTRPAVNLLLRVDGELADARPLEARADGGAVARFTFVAPRPGLYRLEVEGVQRFLRVAPAAAPGQTGFQELRISPLTALVGEPVVVSALVLNASGADRLVWLELEVNGVPMQVSRQYVEAPSATRVEFRFVPRAAGTYRVGLAGLRGELEVARPPRPAALEVRELEVRPALARPQEVVTVRVLLANVGEEPGEHTVRLWIDEATVAERTVRVEGLTLIPVTFQVQRQDTRSYAVRVDGLKDVFKVALRPPTDLVVMSLMVEPAVAPGGTPVTVLAEVQNVTGRLLNGTVLLKINDVVRDEGAVSLNPGELRAFTATISVDTPGLHNVELVVTPQGGSVASVRTAQFLATRPLALPTFELVRLDVTPREVGPGDLVQVRVLLANLGELEGEYAVRLSVDGLPVEERPLSVPGLATVPVSFSVKAESPGRHVVEIEGLRGEFLVRPLARADIVLGGLAVEPGEAPAGEPVVARLEVRNRGDARGDTTVTLEVNGVSEAVQGVSLDAGERRTLTFSIVRDQPGTYQVSVEELTATFTVLARSSLLGAWAWALSGVLVTVVVAAMAYLLYRRLVRRPTGQE